MNKNKLRKWADRLCETTWCNPRTYPDPGLVRNVEKQLTAMLEKHQKEREDTLARIESLAGKWPNMVIQHDAGRWRIHERFEEGKLLGITAEGRSIQEAVDAAFEMMNG
jgi:hypothetical protein